MQPLNFVGHPQLLVGHQTGDDASVYQLTLDLAIINTLDFFTPIVDDPYLYGQIAAANSISDVFAMGGEPFVALNILAFHQGKVKPDVVSKILQGGIDKAAEIGVVIAGGHSIQDLEIKYGLAVTGTVHPQKIWRNDTVKLADVLVLTKPIGTGVVSTAIKQGKCPARFEEEIVESMLIINAQPVRLAREFDLNVHACTDVTGFGLAGHLMEMLSNEQYSALLSLEDIPRFKAFEAFFEDYSLWPGGLHGNRIFAQENMLLKKDPGDPKYSALFDPQTNGGLLMAMPEKDAKILQKELSKSGYPFKVKVIGKIIESSQKKIILQED